MKNSKTNNNDNVVKLSQKIKDVFHNKDFINYYKQSFLIGSEEQNIDYNTTKFKREQLLSKLMDEEIPGTDIIKRALEKENDQLLKEINKEKFFQNIFQNIYNTLSHEERECIRKNLIREDVLKSIKANSTPGKQKKFQSKENNLIYNLCHNFMSFDDIDFDNIV